VTPRLRRFASVGALVTAADLGLLAALRHGGDVPLPLADAAAVTAASVLSFTLHRSVTFADDPYVRWVQRPLSFAFVSSVAGLVDVGVLLALAAPVDTDRLPSLLAVKAAAIMAGGMVRIVGYRRLLFDHVRAVQARLVQDRPPAPGDLRLTVVIPAYGEQERIGATIAAVRAALTEVAVDGGLEIVVVDDGSTDATSDAARTGGADQVVTQPHNRGKGAAVRAGIAVAKGRTIAFTDADLSYSPEHLLALLAKVEAGWDMVVGSRRHVETTVLVRARRLREVSGRLFNAFTTAVLLGQYRDTQCGLKAFRSDVARRLAGAGLIDGFAFDVELFHLAERDLLSLAEVPVSVVNSETSTMSVGRDAVRMVRDLFRIRRWAAEGRYGTSPPLGKVERRQAERGRPEAAN
jgi:putative flippase GtrA